VHCLSGLFIGQSVWIRAKMSTDWCQNVLVPSIFGPKCVDISALVPKCSTDTLALVLSCLGSEVSISQWKTSFCWVVSTVMMNGYALRLSLVNFRPL